MFWVWWKNHFGLRLIVSSNIKGICQLEKLQNQSTKMTRGMEQFLQGQSGVEVLGRGTKVFIARTKKKLERWQGNGEKCLYAAYMEVYQFPSTLEVVLDVNSELHVKVNEEKDLAPWPSIRRHKREWVKFARPIRERDDNSKRNPIATIHSDFQEKQNIKYRISGVGIDQPPYGVFIIDENTGAINITAIVDREEVDTYLINCRAVNDWGQDVERLLVLRVKVLDINDNPPIFSQTVFSGQVEENSPINTLIMAVNATDADEPNTLNSKIAFKIVSQEPAAAPMFILNRHTGEVRTMTNTLDREQFSSYRLLIRGSDLDGAEHGLSSDSECEIEITDVNDNFPFFQHSEYSTQIEENVLSAELLRLQVTDLDEIFSDNWLAEFFFTSGNEGKWFKIHTDRTTNEGILSVVKTLDYEQMQNVQLGIAVKNVAEFHHTVIHQYRIQSTPVRIKIINVKEGIVFKPPSKKFTVQRGIRGQAFINYILGTYVATDEDTGRAVTSIRYIMGRNEGGLLAVDSRTAEIKFVKVVDRDLTFIINKTFTAEILAIDESGKTATGTILVEIPDFIESCPIIGIDRRTVCSVSPSIIVTARAPGSKQNQGPFTFSLANQPPGKRLWTIQALNATAAEVKAQQPLAFGTHSVSLNVKGGQDRNCEASETLTLQVCDCDSNQRCINQGTTAPTITVHGGKTANRRGERRVGLGPAGIGLLILGLLLLLLVPLLLLFCDCGAGAFPAVGAGFIPVPEEPDGGLHKWGIEGAQPKDKEVGQVCGSTTIVTNGTECVETSGEVCTNAGGAVVDGASGMEMITCSRHVTASRLEVTNGMAGFCGTRSRHSTGGTLRECAEGSVNMAFLDSYFSQKALACTDEDDVQRVNDCLLIYDDEGIEAPKSPTGSVGCCSFIADDLDDSFLDNLGPKFKKLAAISLGLDDENQPTQSSVPTPGSQCQAPSPQPPCAGSPSPTPCVSVCDPLSMAPVPDRLHQGNFLVTETYTSSGSFRQAPAGTIDSQISQNVVVTERVFCPVPIPGGNLGTSSELSRSRNVIYSEEPCSVLTGPGPVGMI
ncbi:desmoglein-3-like [Tachyglossus aculeatus]|uniref:desmoglein-3-like n=1 Tax=Tachyglossus aculeatus TaxID=9261 RepID=UPI0018F5CCD9|nr:desmoglein-3-like [Tachyglossus aculeatus]